MPIAKPAVNISLASATNVLNIGTRRDLIVCQAPGVTVNALVQSVHSKTQSELDSLLGAGKYGRVMVQEWLDANRVGNNYGAELDVITLMPDAAATAATKTITIVGTATVSTTIDVSILSAELYKETITVASGDDETAVATAIAAAFSGVVAPFSVSSSLGVVTITALDLGTIGNDYGVEVSALPGGMTSITVADGVTATGTPSVTSVMDLVGSIRYQGILWPVDLKASAATEVIDFLDTRFNSSNDVLDGVAFVGLSDTLSNIATAVNLINSQSAVYMGNAITVGNDLKIGPEVVHPVDWTAAEFMAIRARRLTENASISSVVVATASGDQFGGEALASLPYFNTPLAGTPVTTSPNTFSQIEQTELNEDGYTVVGPNRPLTDTIMGAVVSTYKTDSSGNEDTSYKYLNYIDTASICREVFFTNLASLFQQSRLTDGDLLPNRSMENAASIKGVVLSLFAVLKDAALIRKGRVADKLISDNLTVTLDLANRKATIASVLPIVTQLETVNATLQLSFEL